MAEDGRQDVSPHLTAEEEAATKKFLENVNKWRSARQLEEVSHVHLTASPPVTANANDNIVQLPWPSAVKFLMARKFNVERALVLYHQHEIMR